MKNNVDHTLAINYVVIPNDPIINLLTAPLSVPCRLLLGVTVKPYKLLLAAPLSGLNKYCWSMVQKVARDSLCPVTLKTSTQYSISGSAPVILRENGALHETMISSEKGLEESSRFRTAII